MDLVFGYLELLRQAGPQRWAWEEMADIAAMKFRFLEEEEVSQWVTGLSADMHHYAPEHILSGAYVYEGWDADLVSVCV